MLISQTELLSIVFYHHAVSGHLKVGDIILNHWCVVAGSEEIRAKCACLDQTISPAKGPGWWEILDEFSHFRTDPELWITLELCL